MHRLRERIIEFFYRNAKRQGRHHDLLTVLVGLTFGCIVFLIVPLALLTDRLLSLQAWPPYPANRIISIPLLAVGIWLWLWSVLTFFKFKGTPVPFSPPPKLIDTGPYAYSRNPMLSGIFIVFYGIGFLFQSLSLIAFYTPLFIGFAFLEFKMIEEPELVKRIGAPYVEYRKKVPMFFPRPGRHRRHT
jgi:protein-S-isoprenylcysteine O-methyltransferase Ste14